MAYPIEEGSILQVSMVGTNAGQMFVSLFNYWFTDGPTIDDGHNAALESLGELAAAGKLLEKYTNIIGPNITNIEFYAQWIDPTRYARVRDFNGPYAGTHPFDSLSPNYAVAITKRGQGAGRHDVGTLHMPGVPSSAIENGMLTAGALIDYNALRDQVIAGFTIAGARTFNPILFNRAEPSASAYISTGFVQPTARVSRRRTVGVGA